MDTRTTGRPRSFDREAVLDNAVRQFWEHGYEATSVRDLTSAVGITAPSLYRAFGDKQALFGEVVDAYVETYGGFIDRALEQESTARDVAARILREGPERYTRTELPRGCLVVSADIGTTNREVSDLLRGVRTAKVAQLAARIRADVRSGALQRCESPHALALFTLGTLGAMAQAARDGASRTDLRRVGRVALAAWPGA